MTGLLWTNWNIDVKDDRIWFVPFYGHVLCGYNLVDEKLDKIIPQNFSQDEMAAFFVKCYGEKIVLAPDRDNEIRVVTEKNILHYKLEDNSTNSKYDCGEVVNGELYLFPRTERCIVKMYRDDIEHIFCEYNGFVSLTSYNGEIWGVNRTNVIYSFNIEKKCFQEHHVKVLNDSESIVWIDTMKNGCIISTLNGEVFFLENFDSEKAKIICKAVNGDFFRSGIASGDRYFLFPFKDATKVFFYNYNSEELEFNKIDDKYSYEWAHDAFGVPVNYKDRIYIMSPKHEALLELDSLGKLRKKHFITIEPENPVRQEIMDNDFAKNDINGENVFWSLKEYINYLCK